MRMPRSFLSLLLWTGALSSFLSGSVTATQNLRTTKRILQDDEESTRTDLVRLIPFDVQIAISYNTQEELEAINVVALTDIITDWMSDSFRTKSTSQLLEEAENSAVTTTFDSVALELADQRLQTSQAANQQPIALLTGSYEGVSLWERSGSSSPMDPELVELMQRATFLEDNALLEMLQTAPTSITGFPSEDSVIDVRAFITPPSNTQPPAEAPTSPPDNNKNLEIIIIIAIVVACLAFGLLIFAVVWAWKSDQKNASGSSKAARSSKRSRVSRTSSKRSKNNKNKNSASSPKATTEESTPSPTGQQDPLEGSEFDFGGGAGAVNTSSNKGAVPRQEAAAVANNSSGNDPNAADSVFSEDVSTSLTAYYKSGMYGSSGNNPARPKDFNDAASMSSMDSYGYSLDGYAPSLGPAPQGGYPVGPLQAAKDAPMPLGDASDDDVLPKAADEEVEDYEAQT